MNKTSKIRIWGGEAIRGQEKGRHKGTPEGKDREACSGQRVESAAEKESGSHDKNLDDADDGGHC